MDFVIDRPLKKHSHQGTALRIFFYADLHTLKRMSKHHLDTWEENVTLYDWSYTSEYFFLILACHQRGVIHRDIKDENLLVTISPHSKPKIELIDFGSGAHIGVNEIYFDFDGKFHNYFILYIFFDIWLSALCETYFLLV